jgi:hypothetical protein
MNPRDVSVCSGKMLLAIDPELPFSVSYPPQVFSVIVPGSAQAILVVPDHGNLGICALRQVAGGFNTFLFQKLSARLFLPDPRCSA